MESHAGILGEPRLGEARNGEDDPPRQIGVNLGDPCSGEQNPLR